MVDLQYLYKATVLSFLNDNKVLEKMQERAQNRIVVSNEEFRSWSESIKALKSLFMEVSKRRPSFLSSLVILEATLCGRRADCFVFGENIKCENEGTLLIIELKQWSGKFVSLPDNEEDVRAGYVMTNFSDTPKRPHPSYQASDYKWIPNMIPAFKDDYIKRVSLAYCYNCERGTQTFDVLYNVGYKDYRTDCKLYTKHTFNKLVNVLVYNVGCGAGQKVFDVFIKYDD